MARKPVWQRREGKAPGGGLNATGRASLRAIGYNAPPPPTADREPPPPAARTANNFRARMCGAQPRRPAGA
jgi:hypothetical protein